MKQRLNQSKTRGLDVTIESQRRKQIIEAARACISEDGVEKLTLRKVGERAQVSHGTIAYYFHTRKELIDSALLEISEDFMEGLRRRQLLYGMRDLVDLIETFLDPENSSARFVVQMIDAGLHDGNLRGTHDEFVTYGRERIEKSIRVAIEMGDLRDDVDPALAAALFHTVLIWWQSELAAGTTSRRLALDVGRLVLRLLESPEKKTSERPTSADARNGATRNGNRVSPRAVTASPIEMIEASLLDDPKLSEEAKTTLAEAFKNLYHLAADKA